MKREKDADRLAEMRDLSDLPTAIYTVFDDYYYYFDPLWYGRLGLGMTRRVVNVQHVVYSNRDTR